MIGTDADPHNIHRSEVDVSYLCPRANDPKYIPFLVELIKEERVDFLHSQPEIEAFTIGKHRDAIEAAGCKLFMPAQRTIELLRDKWESYRIWREAGITVPETMFLNHPDDLTAAFKRFGKDIWIRETVGAAGKGSVRVTGRRKRDEDRLPRMTGALQGSTKATVQVMVSDGSCFSAELQNVKRADEGKFQATK